MSHAIASLSASEQKEFMRDWFREHFEDPAERTPYESKEGGYVWIWGGPHDARDELTNAFDIYVDIRLIDELANELEVECVEWAPTPSPDDYSDYAMDEIAGRTDAYEQYQSAINNINELLVVTVPDPTQQAYFRMLYVAVITALETYLSDDFISRVIPDAALVRRFVERSPAFQKEKISKASTFEFVEGVSDELKRTLGLITWHDLARVQAMYRDTLEIDFPSELGDLYRAILNRHDFVHRNGKDKGGAMIGIAESGVRELIDDANRVVEQIHGQLEGDLF